MFTSEELETLISIATAALGPGVALVEKLIAAKSETDAQRLNDASTEDQDAINEANQDGATS